MLKYNLLYFTFYYSVFTIAVFPYLSSLPLTIFLASTTFLHTQKALKLMHFSTICFSIRNTQWIFLRDIKLTYSFKVTTL